MRRRLIVELVIDTAPGSMDAYDEPRELLVDVATFLEIVGANPNRGTGHADGYRLSDATVWFKSDLEAPTRLKRRGKRFPCRAFCGSCEDENPNQGSPTGCPVCGHRACERGA